MRGDFASPADIKRGAHKATCLNTKLAQKTICKRAGGDTRRGFTRAGSLQCFAAIGGEPLHTAGKIGVARTRTRNRRRFCRVIKAIVFIGNSHGDWTAHGHAAANTRNKFSLVGFHALTRATAVTGLAAFELAIDELAINGKPRRNSFHDGKQTWSVTFTGGEISQCHASIIRMARLGVSDGIGSS